MRTNNAPCPYLPLFWGILLALTSCSVQRHVETVTHRDTAHVSLADSVRYEDTTAFSDTTHHDKTETEKVRTIEYFDPETGKLRQRITESNRKRKSVLDQRRTIQHHIDSLETHRNDSLAAKTDEVTEKESKAAITMPWYVGIGGLLLLCALVGYGARWFCRRFVP